MAIAAEGTRGQAESMYYRVLGKVWAVEDEAGRSIAGVSRSVGMPVSKDGRRPVIGVELMDVKAEKEPTNVSVYKLPDGALRLAFSAPDELYGRPLAPASDYGEPVSASGEPVNRSVGVELAPDEDPKLVVEQVDGTWDVLDDIATRDTVRVAGAITRALVATKKPLEIIDSIPEDQLRASLSD